MKFIWKVYMIPVMDYCSQVWSPSYGAQLLRLENLQRSFTSRITGLKHLNYWERLDKLKILSVGRRMERYKIIYTRKILTGETANCGIEWDANARRGVMCNVD